MYKKLTIADVREKCRTSSSDQIYQFTVNLDCKTEFICNEHGLLFRKMKTGNWKEVKNTSNHAKGYNVIVVNKKQFSRAKLILLACNKINIEDKNRNIYHKNLNRLDCSMNNLTFEIP